MVYHILRDIAYFVLDHSQLGALSDVNPVDQHPFDSGDHDDMPDNPYYAPWKDHYRLHYYNIDQDDSRKYYRYGLHDDLHHFAGH